MLESKVYHAFFSGLFILFPTLFLIFCIYDVDILEDILPNLVILILLNLVHMPEEQEKMIQRSGPFEKRTHICKQKQRFSTHKCSAPVGHWWDDLGIAKVGLVLGYHLPFKRANTKVWSVTTTFWLLLDVIHGGLMFWQFHIESANWIYWILKPHLKEQWIVWVLTIKPPTR